MNILPNQLKNLLKIFVRYYSEIGTENGIALDLLVIL